MLKTLFVGLGALINHANIAIGCVYRADIEIGKYYEFRATFASATDEE